MNGTDFITLAGKLAASTVSDLDEARYRTAASRAYYGAFHEVSSLLRELEVTVRRNAYGHQDAYDQLWQSGHELARKVAGLLGDLRLNRIRADYRLEHESFQDAILAKTCVELAYDLMSCLDRCRIESDEIKAAIHKS